MPPQRPEPLFIDKARWQGQEVYFRKDYLILKVIVPSGQDADILQTVHNLLNQHVGTSYGISARFGTWVYIKLPENTDVPHLAEDLATQTTVVDYAEPDLAMRLTGSLNDPLLTDEHVNAYGEIYQQWAIEYLDMDTAWELENGEDSVLIGLVDTGIWIDDGCIEHLTYQSAMDGCTNCGGDPNNLNGCLAHPDLDGKRFLAGNNYLYEPPVPVPFDDNGHGTNMAGVIAATADNEKGIAGLNWVSPVYVCRVADEKDETTAALVLQAVKEIIEYAKSTNRKAVINLSVTFADDIEDLDVGTLEEFVTLAVAEDPILVCAVGNQGEEVKFPAALAKEYPSNIVSVGAIGKNGEIWAHSNYDMTHATAAAPGPPGPAGEPAVSVVAPGDDLATTDYGVAESANPIDGYVVASGTSEATAHVTGLISLMWSMNPNMKAREIIRCLKRTAYIPVDILENWSDADGYPIDKYGYGIINPAQAINRVDWAVELLTPQIDFEDIPEGLEPSQRIKLHIESCARVSFEVTTAGDDFGIADGIYTHLPGDGPVFDQLAATYAASMPLDVSSTVTIRWREMPGEDPFVVEITANRIGPKRSAIVLAVDKSGSMNVPSGIGLYSRMDIAKYSSGVLIDLIDVQNAMGIVSFDGTAHHVTDVTLIDQADPNAARDVLKTGINGLSADGMTSIGAGIERAGLYLDSIPPEMIEGDETKAVIVLTDGYENRGPFISDILAAGYQYPVYAVGVGTPDTLGLDALGMMTEITGGNLLISGGLDADGENLLAAFFSKILAEINGDDVALDPTHRLRARHTHEFKIKLTHADRQVDLILMRPPGAVVDVELIAPTGDRIPESTGGVTVVEGTRVSRYRTRLPAVDSPAHASHAGTWRARVSIKASAFNDLMTKIKSAGVNPRGLEDHGFRYTLQAHVRSDLRMRAHLHQNSYEPDATFSIRALLTENDLPLLDAVTAVTATITQPGGLEKVIRLVQTEPGLYEAEYQVKLPGVYFCNVVAEGRSNDGDKYRREALLTGAIRHFASGGLNVPGR